MQILQILTESRTILELSGSEKTAVLASLAELLSEVLPNTTGEKVLEVLLERERLGSTGIGKGIAIPHGRFEGITAPIAALGRSPQGIQFEALDGKPVHLIIALASPADTGKTHLQALSTISRLLRNKGIRQNMMKATSRESLLKALLGDGEPE